MFERMAEGRSGKLGSLPKNGAARGRIIGLLSLFCVAPLALLAYLVYGRLVPLLDPSRHSGESGLVHVLSGLALLLIAGAGFMIWRLGTGTSPAAERQVEPATIQSPSAAPTDEIGTLMSSFSRVLSTVEQQAGEIDRFSQRLEAAYKQLDSTNARLKEFSFKDEVTRLYNRRFFSIRLEEEVSRYRRFNHPVSVVLLDLDGFKAINDELGHAAGDETLRDVAEILLKYSRGINVICRYGGDEFAVLLVETSKAGARLYADRIRHVLSTHPFAHGRQLTASFGIASLPEDVAPGTEDLVRAADEALYAAKRAGKNRVSVYENVVEERVMEPEAKVE